MRRNNILASSGPFGGRNCNVDWRLIPGILVFFGSVFLASASYPQFAL
jgi:hypothetical protein